MFTTSSDTAFHHAAMQRATRLISLVMLAGLLLPSVSYAQYFDDEAYLYDTSENPCASDGCFDAGDDGYGYYNNDYYNEPPYDRPYAYNSPYAPTYGGSYNQPNIQLSGTPTGNTDLFGNPLCDWADYGISRCDFNPHQWLYDPWTGTWY